MGLDFNRSEAHWSYSGFGRFRNKLWNSCGFTGELYELYDNNEFLKQIKSNHPLFSFFNHSDCDGELTISQMRKIFPAIRNIVDNWEENDFDKNEAIVLCDDMEQCVKNKKKLKFM